VKLYVYLQLKAQWSGLMLGWVECSYEDLADGLGWDKRKLKRTIAELKSKGYIEVGALRISTS
jgi:DNA-binding MarR family transcriptional regulator